MIQDLTPDLAKSFGLKKETGVLISDVVDGSPAQKAGIKRGDVIVDYNGKEVKTAHDLSRMVAETSPGTKVKIALIRNGKTRKLAVTIGTRGETITKPEVPATSEWGIKVQPLTPRLASRYGLEKGETGVMISYVRPDSPAANVGLRPGDIIKEVNRKRVKGLQDFNMAIKSADKHEGILLLAKRGEGTFYVVLKKQT